MCSKLSFESIAEFQKWKLQMEQETITKFVKETRSYKTTKNVLHTKFICHRSGKPRLIDESVRKRALKVKGSCKTGEICPAFIRVEQTESNITVFFNGNHSNHENELRFITLTSIEKDEIADRLKKGVPFNRILDDIRDSFNIEDEKLTRYHLMTKKDLHNICSMHHIAFKERFSGDDCTSVEKMVETYAKKFQDDTPFKLFKKQASTGPKDPLGTTEDDFLLVIMTTGQKQMFKQFGSNGIICIDGTHGTNAYGFTLTTILVIDDYGMGMAAAHFISNRENETFMTIFFETVKKECGDTKAKVFMSDDYPAYINAWKKVMEPPEKTLLCTWHVDKNIRKNLPLIQGGVELKAEVYKLIRTVMVETNLDNFNELLQQTVDRLLNDEATEAFGKYFKKEYVSRASMWAYAHRLGVGINTNMKLEALHRVLKHVYFRGLKIKRLDQAIYLLLKMNRDRLFDRATHLVMNADTHTLRTIRQRHMAGQLIQKECISHINPSTYSVISQSDKSNSYEVTTQQNDCSCNLRCSKCTICVHSFTCACLDNSVQGHICKHIHAVVIHFGGVQNLDQETESGISKSKETEGNELLTSIQPTITSEVPRNDSKNPVDCFVEEANKLAISCQQLDRSDPKNIAVCEEAMKALKICVSLFDKNAVKKKPSTSKTQEPWNKKADKQLRFYSTQKKRFNPYSASLTKPTTAQMSELKTLLKNANETQVKHVHSTFDHLYN